jgi:hypothetical protein
LESEKRNTRGYLVMRKRACAAADSAKREKCPQSQCRHPNGLPLVRSEYPKAREASVPNVLEITELNAGPDHHCCPGVH